MLDEDIYFETALDGFDPFPHMLKILSTPAPGSSGERLVGVLSNSQRTVVQKVLSTEQPKQN